MYECFFSPAFYVGLDGLPIKRTPETHPYSYEEFFTYKSDDFMSSDRMVYSDRMLQWDRAAFTSAVRKVWPDKPCSQFFHGKKPEDINRFLNLYFGHEVVLTAIVQGCNASTGYPYWVFAYREIKAEEV